MDAFFGVSSARNGHLMRVTVSPEATLPIHGAMINRSQLRVLQKYQENYT